MSLFYLPNRRIQKMETVLEMPDTPPKETPAEVPETPVSTPVEPAPQTPETETPAAPAPVEPTFDIDGEKLTASQIKELREKYERDSKWIQSNEARAAELNRQEEELRQIRAFKGLVDQRPDVLQQLIQPPPQRNF